MSFDVASDVKSPLCTAHVAPGNLTLRRVESRNLVPSMVIPDASTEYANAVLR